MIIQNRIKRPMLHIAHSPDSDDAFMFYALANEKISSPSFAFKHILSDIETLNREAMKGTYEISAISFHAFPQVSTRYALLPSGASMGDNYGPMIIARTPLSPRAIRQHRIAIPGVWTTAFLALRLYEPAIQYQVMPFQDILPAVAEGKADLGLIIHEGQLTYQDAGLHCVLDLGQWWYEKTSGLPLPLGGNVLRKDLVPDHGRELADLLKAAIRYSLDHRDEALRYALSFARGMKPETANRFVGMYVNDLTVDYGERGRMALQRLFEEAWRSRLIAEKPVLEFIKTSG